MATRSHLARAYEEIFFGAWRHYNGRLRGQDADDLIILDEWDYVDMHIIAEVLWAMSCARYPWCGPPRVEGG